MTELRFRKIPAVRSAALSRWRSFNPFHPILLYCFWRTSVSSGYDEGSTVRRLYSGPGLQVKSSVYSSSFSTLVIFSLKLSRRPRSVRTNRCLTDTKPELVERLFCPFICSTSLTTSLLLRGLNYHRPTDIIFGGFSTLTMCTPRLAIYFNS